MARIPDEALERLKREVSLTRLIEAQSQDSGGLSAGTSQSTVSNVQPDGPFLAQEPFIDPFLLDQTQQCRPLTTPLGESHKGGRGGENRDALILVQGK